MSQSSLTKRAQNPIHPRLESKPKPTWKHRDYLNDPRGGQQTELWLDRGSNFGNTRGLAKQNRHRRGQSSEERVPVERAD
jgi:hypothetical protein